MKLERRYITGIIVAICALFIIAQTSSAAPTINVDPSSINALQGDSFTVNISIYPDGTEVFGAEYKLFFNNTQLNVLNQIQGNFLSQDGASTNIYMNDFDNTIGKIEYGEGRISVTNGVIPPAKLASIEFEVRCSGNSELNLQDVVLANPAGGEISGVTINNALVDIPQSNPVTPFFIYGNISCADSSDCNNPVVTITNLNTSKQWTAEILGNSNYYQITLESCTDVVEDEILQFSVTNQDGTESKVIEHPVTQAEVNDGGFELNIQLELTSVQDDSPPVVTDHSPTGTNVAMSSDITVTFNETMNQTSAEAAFSIDPDVNGVTTWSDNTMTFDPDADLTEDTIYNITISTAAEDPAGNALEAPFTWNFTTTTSAGDDTPPVVTDHSPTGTDVAMSSDITVTFNETMNQTSAEAAFSIDPDVNGVTTWSDNTMTFDPDADLTEDTIYNVTISTAAKDVAGNALEAPFTWNFTTTTSAGDDTPPVVTDHSPTGTDVAMSSDITVTFNETMNQTSAEAAFSIDPDVNGVTTWSDNTMTFDPDADLTEETTFNVTISTAAEDPAGNALEAPFTWNFTTTTSAGDDTPPVVTDHSPTGTDVAMSSDITVTFNETMNQTSAEAAFSIDPDVNGVTTWSDNTMTFDPDADLTEETTFNVTISTAAEDPAGNALVTPYSWEFTTETAASLTTTVSIEDVTLAPGETITVPVMISNVENLGGCGIEITFNASVVHITGVTQGDMDNLTDNVNNDVGWMFANDLSASGLSEDVVVFAYINLTAIGTGGDDTLLDITVLQLTDTGYDPINHTVIDGTFTIEADNEAPLVTDVSASPDTILNDNGRPRAPGTNITTLNVTVIDAGSDVANVTIDLFAIGGSAEEPMIRDGETDVWTVTTNAVSGINLTHQLTITATDSKGNINNSESITLTVLRRGDVCRDNNINMNDVIYIARYLAQLEPEYSAPPTVLVGDVVGLSGNPVGDNNVDLMDALYLARFTAGLEGEP